MWLRLKMLFDRRGLGFFVNHVIQMNELLREENDLLKNENSLLKEMVQLRKKGVNI